MKKILQNKVIFCTFFEKAPLLAVIISPKNGLDWALPGQIFALMIHLSNILFIFPIILGI